MISIMHCVTSVVPYQPSLSQNLAYLNFICISIESQVKHFPTPTILHAFNDIFLIQRLKRTNS